MKSYKMIVLLFMLSALLFFMACDNDSNSNPKLYGTLTDAHGSAVQGARVIAMERESNEKYTTLTHDNGTYTLRLPKGTYDLAVDDANAHATCFTGPIVIVQGSVNEIDAQLPADSVTDDTVYGTITHDRNADLSGWTVVFVSNVGKNGEASLPETTVTLDAQSSFSASLGGECMMDINIYDADGTLVEFVDFGKLSGPCQLDFIVGTGMPNLYRHDTGIPNNTYEATSGSVVSGTQVIHQIMASATNDVFSISCSEKSGEDKVFDTDDYTDYHFTIDDGKLGVSGGHLKIDFWNDPDDCLNALTGFVYLHEEGDESSEYDIEVKDDGSWWYDYKVHIYANGPLPEDVVFEDETHDTYSLNITDPGWHWHDVNYNSDHPTLIKITVYGTTTDSN